MATTAEIAVRETLRTGLGMFALWNRNDFAGIVDYETWRPELGDDQAIERQAAQGTLIPIRVSSFNPYTFEIRVGSPGAPAELTQEEKRSVADIDGPFPFRSLGGLNLSAIEAIGSEVGNDVARVRIDPGEYMVRVYQLGLPDFVILVNPA